jgi:folate-binding Fe-S cluster repair protein YgfZ
MTTALLTDRGVIALWGAEARGFLQGLITNEMAECLAGHALYAALLTPQGKILFEFFVVADGERFLLDCAAARSEELAKRLGFYRLRAKVNIAPQPDMAVAASWGEDAPKKFGIVFPDPRLPALGVRMIVPRGARLPIFTRTAFRLACRTAPTSRQIRCTHSTPGWKS